MVVVVRENVLRFGNVFLDGTWGLDLVLRNVRNSFRIGGSTPLVVTSYRLVG